MPQPRGWLLAAANERLVTASESMAESLSAIAEVLTGMAATQARILNELTDINENFKT